MTNSATIFQRIDFWIHKFSLLSAFPNFWVCTFYFWSVLYVQWLFFSVNMPNLFIIYGFYVINSVCPFVFSINRDWRWAWVDGWLLGTSICWNHTTEKPVKYCQGESCLILFKLPFHQDPNVKRLKSKWTIFEINTEIFQFAEKSSMIEPPDFYFLYTHSSFTLMIHLFKSIFHT